MDFPQIYVDGDDVERGHYVYAHVCKASGKIFYVGRGKLGRAWDQDKRSEAWKDHVSGLAAGYEIRLLHRDLTEEQSIHLEREEIESNGGAASEGGALINWIPGDAGDGIGLGFEIGLDLYAGDEEARKNAVAQDEAYRAVRKFKDLTRHEKLAHIAKFEFIVGPKCEPLDALIERCESHRNSKYPAGIDDARDLASEIQEIATRLERRGMSFLDFCYGVEALLDQLELCIDDAKPPHRKLVVDLYNAAREWFDLFDSGNREEANRAAQDEWVRQGGREKLRKLLLDNPHLDVPELRGRLGGTPSDGGDSTT